jgi:coenzyme F420-reducing hydrogenase beta subunit
VDDIVRMKHEFLKGKRDKSLGVYSELFSAKSGIDGQDGGMVTALLISGFKKGIFDAAIVAQRTEGYHAEAVIAENINEVMAAKGTTYLRVRMMLKLKELLSRGKKKIAVVCTPCEVRAARRIQQRLMREASGVEITIIGLFCLEAFSSDKLKDEVQRLTGADIDKAEKTKIHKGKFIVQLQGNEYSCKVRDLDKAVEKGCNYCNDFPAMFADISVGSVGSPSGYSTVIVRSDVGKRLLKDLDIVKAEAEKEEVIKLSKFKKDHAEKTSLPSTTGNSTETKKRF